MTLELKKPRYFVYLSDAKVDSFYKQLHPSRLNSLLPERLSLAISRFKLSVARKPTTQNDYEKLEEVLSALEDTAGVGTPWRPESYFKGILSMRWDRFSRETLYNDDALVCFGHLTWAGPRMLAVILVGSSLHVMSARENGKRALSEGAEAAFKHGYSYDVGEVTRAVKYELARQSLEVEELFAHQSDMRLWEMATTLIEAAERLPEPAYELSFFAKTLYAGRIPFKYADRKFPILVDFVLGTPFYVALEG